MSDLSGWTEVRYLGAVETCRFCWATIPKGKGVAFYRRIALVDAEWECRACHDEMIRAEAARDRMRVAVKRFGVAVWEDVGEWEVTADTQGNIIAGEARLWAAIAEGRESRTTIRVVPRVMASRMRGTSSLAGVVVRESTSVPKSG